MRFFVNMDASLHISKINFGAKLNTIGVLESTTGRIIGDNGIEGLRSIILAFPDAHIDKNVIKYKGFRFRAMEIGKLIKTKYPDIARATDRINSIVDNNPAITKFELQKEIQPIIEDLGRELDIVL